MASETVDDGEQTITIKEYLNEVEEEELVIFFVYSDSGFCKFNIPWSDSMKKCCCLMFWLIIWKDGIYFVWRDKFLVNFLVNNFLSSNLSGHFNP